MIYSSDDVFLIDTNSILTPYLSYYTFDFAPKFWNQLERDLTEGSIAILDLVKKEIEAGNDKLSAWMNAIHTKILIDHREEAIIQKYSEVLNFIQTSGFYNDKALAKWAGNVADPWLIAASSVYGYTIITLEQSAGGISKRNPSSNPKIPDVCNQFDVKCEGLYYMMRQLSYSLG